LLSFPRCPSRLTQALRDISGGFFYSKEKQVTKKIDLIGINNDFEEQAGSLVRRDSQYIAPSLLDELKDKRHESASQREGEFMHVATIPTIIIEKWQKEGFDIMAGKVPFKDIIKKLKEENLEGFMATDKSI
jgi:hypothetical protein